MKKEEYLNCIEQALKAYDKDYVDEIIRDYEEHFPVSYTHLTLPTIA